MYKTLLTLLTLTSICTISQAQVNAALLRYPDVSATQIVFTYANDLWVVPKTGGTATHLSSPAGVEVYPKFSPDGRTIAYTADYDGSNSIYSIPSAGGIPTRLTWYGAPERVAGWYPDGKYILFASGRESGRDRFNQFYKIPATGGAPQKLPLPYAEYGTLSPDASHLAFTFTSQVGRNWKRYHGGWRGQIHLFDLNSYADENISTTDADDELPMWHDHSVYFLSDRGDDKRMNLWEYDIPGKKFNQLTHFTDYDAHYASVGPEDIVFEQGGHLWLYTFATHDTHQVPVQAVFDETSLRPSLQPTEHQTASAFISPDGKRVLFEARGDIYSVPAENGPVIDLTRTSDIAERYPAWSPDGKYIAYWSDRSGEYELTMRETGKPDSEKKLTSYGPGFRYNIFWSPDSKKLAFIDKAMKNLYLMTGSAVKPRRLTRANACPKAPSKASPPTGPPIAGSSLTTATSPTTTAPSSSMMSKPTSSTPSPPAITPAPTRPSMSPENIYSLLPARHSIPSIATRITPLFTRTLPCSPRSS